MNVRYLDTGAGDSSSIDTYSPIHIAVLEGDTEVVRALIAAKANLNATTDFGATPIYLASQNNYPAIVRLLAEAGADVNRPYYDSSAKVVRALIAAKADLERPFHDGSTPLYVASLNNHPAVVAALAKVGADVNPFTDSGTPLFIASESGHTEVVRALLGHPLANGLRVSSLSSW